MKIFFKKNFKFFLSHWKRSCSFAPASRDTQCESKETENKIRHVPRHIELTAVFKRDFKNKRIRVMRSRDFKKPLDLQSKINRVSINWNSHNIRWRVWSWLRMNASGRLNTCKSRGSYLRIMRPAHGCVTRMQSTFHRGIAQRNLD